MATRPTSNSRRNPNARKPAPKATPAKPATPARRKPAAPAEKPAAPAKRPAPRKAAKRPVKPAPRAATAKAKPAAKSPAAKDVTQYASADKVTDFHRAFARWIVTEVGYNPDEAGTKRAAFLRGVAIATAARPAFTASDFLAEWREENGVAKRGPKPKDAADAKRRSNRAVVTDDEFVDESDEFEDDESTEDDDALDAEIVDEDEDTDESEEDDADDEDEWEDFEDDEDSDDSDDEDESEEDSDDEFEDDEPEDEPEPAPVRRGRSPRKVTQANTPVGKTSAKGAAGRAARNRQEAKTTVKDDDFLF